MNNGEIFLSRVNAHHKVTPAEKDFNNQVDGLTQSVANNQPFSLITPVIGQWVHEQSGHGQCSHVLNAQYVSSRDQL